MSLYNAAGRRTVTIVTGSSYTGLYASDGSYNGVIAPGPVVGPIGSTHPCGALWVTVGTNEVPAQALDGSFYIRGTVGNYYLAV